MDSPRVLFLSIAVNIEIRISRSVNLPRFGSLEIALVADRIISLVGLQQNRVAKSKEGNKYCDGLGRFCFSERGLLDSGPGFISPRLGDIYKLW